MKNLIILLISLFVLSCGTTPKDVKTSRENTDWKRFKLKGDVKSYREIKFLAVDNFSTIINGEKIKHIYNQEVLFNLDGNKIETNDYIPDGTLANRTVYLYKENQLVEYNEYDSQGMLFGTGKYIIDEKGRVALLNYKTTDGRYNWSESYDYDKAGNIIEVKRFKTKEVIDTREKYLFNEDGKIKETEFYRDNKLISKNVYSYDDEGNFEELNYGDSTIFSYKYNYDSKGNWTKKIVFENKNPSGILMREIEYFD